MHASFHPSCEQGLIIESSGNHNPARTFLGTQLGTSYRVWPGTHPAGTALTSWQPDSNCGVRHWERVVVGGPVAPLGREAPMSVPSQQRPHNSQSLAWQRGGCPSVPTSFCRSPHPSTASSQHSSGDPGLCLLGSGKVSSGGGRGPLPPAGPRS